jgi:hypothetical protein
MAIPCDSNVNIKEIEQISKYTDLDIEVSRMWTMSTTILPVITGALRTIKKELDQNLQLLPGHPSAIQLLKVTQMCTPLVICKVLG